ncbi:MAG: DUF4402 domain-containing protein [Paucibacter sp.]|nr:DUF4402 domain-containing protein [Roseateles sp.]
MKPTSLRHYAVLSALLLAAASAQAASTTATATATVLTPMTITKNTDLSFGNIVGGNGTVTIDTSGARSLAGNTAPAVSGGTALSAAKFTVGGTASQGYAITVTPPANLSSGGNNMAFTAFWEALDTATPTPVSSGTPATFTPAGATSYILLGGTITVGANQAAGTYTGTITVNVDYN